MKAWVYVSPAAAVAAGNLTHGVLPVELTHDFLDELSTPLRDELGNTLGLGKKTAGEVATESNRLGAPPDPRLLGNGPGESASEATLEEVYRLLKVRRDRAAASEAVERARVFTVINEMTRFLDEGTPRSTRWAYDEKDGAIYWNDEGKHARITPTPDEDRVIRRLTATHNERVTKAREEAFAKRTDELAAFDAAMLAQVAKLRAEGEGAFLNYMIEGHALYAGADTLTPDTLAEVLRYNDDRAAIQIARMEANKAAIGTIVTCFSRLEQGERYRAGVMPISERDDILRAQLFRDFTDYKPTKLDLEHHPHIGNVTEFTAEQWAVAKPFRYLVESLPMYEDGVTNATCQVVCVQAGGVDGPEFVQWAIVAEATWLGVDLTATFEFPDDGKTAKPESEAIEPESEAIELVRVAFAEGVRAFANELGTEVDDAHVARLFAYVHDASREECGNLRRYDDASFIRPATAFERARSLEAERDEPGGTGVIIVDGVRCYVD